MNRPEGISESAWEAAKPKAIEFVDWLGRFTVDADAEHVLTTTIALALQSSVEAERAVIRVQVLDAIEPYTRVSTLHNYGPGGLSRVEEAEIRTGTFIQEDILALFERLSKGA